MRIVDNVRDYFTIRRKECTEPVDNEKTNADNSNGKEIGKKLPTYPRPIILLISSF